LAWNDDLYSPHAEASDINQGGNLLNVLASQVAAGWQHNLHNALILLDMVCHKPLITGRSLQRFQVTTKLVD
jgi:hypothetical protein